MNFHTNGLFVASWGEEYRSLSRVGARMTGCTVRNMVHPSMRLVFGLLMLARGGHTYYPDVLDHDLLLSGHSHTDEPHTQTHKTLKDTDHFQRPGENFTVAIARQEK